jgi:hypothetical protein
VARPVRVLIQSSSAAIVAGLDATMRAQADLVVTCEVVRRDSFDGERWRAGRQPDVIVRHVPGGHRAYGGRRHELAVVLAVDDRATGADSFWAGLPR